jgi:frataxin-like iron-binding protein CyaY
MYTDDFILIDPSRDNIEDQINEFKAIFDIEVQGNLLNYLGIRIEGKSDNIIHMSQPHLIASILEDLQLAG